MPKLEIGKTYYPLKHETIVTDSLVKGDGWKVFVLGGSQFGTQPVTIGNLLQ